MPCIWGRHDRSQAFLTVGIFDDGIFDQVSAGGTGHPMTIHVFNALIDTGAQSTCITRTVAEKVGLLPIGMVPITGVSGLQYHNNYLFKVGFAFGKVSSEQEIEEASVHIFERPVEGAELNVGSSKFDVLLGMDILGAGSLKIDGDGSFSFSF